VGLAFAAPPATAAAAPSAQDKAFMTSNAQTNLAEIAAAKIALSRSHSPDIRNLATTMLADHQKAQRELESAARSAGFTLPTAPNPTQQAQAGQLQSVSTLDFPKTYLQIQAQGHLASIKATETEIRSGSDPAVVAYAKTYLPVAQMHLGMVNQAIKGTHVDVAPVTAPALSPAPTAVVTTGPLAHHAKASASSDVGWLIGLAALIFLGIVALGLGLRRSMVSRR
jgi:putative membrane protein